MRHSVFFSSASEHWATPENLYAELDREFQFNYDPCPLRGQVDGTDPSKSVWSKRRVFCNPPYGPKIRSFLERAHEADIAVFLLPARTDTKWFHECVLSKAAEVRFLRGRLKFGGAKTGAPFPSMVVVFQRRSR